MDELIIYKLYKCFKIKFIKTFFYEIIKTFLTIVFGLSIISLTVRAVSFLDLMVDSGYPIITYFKYSFFNFSVLHLN